MEELYQMKKSHLIVFLIACAIIFGAILNYWRLDDRSADRKNLDVEFAGIIRYISYDLKQFPTITIQDKNYYIGGGYHTNHQIEVGDSIVKQRGSDVYKLIKYKSNKIIEFRK